MILRPAGPDQLLITQPDHAALAARIMEHWRADGLPQSPRRAAILRAIEQHDNGWDEIDVAPIVDSATGRILDFINVPDDVKRGIWPRGVERLEDTPYAAALVAQHALHIYRRYRDDSEWRPFFVTMEDLRDRYLAIAPGATLDELVRDYLFVRVGDLASLTFCNAWTEVQTEVTGYTIALTGDRLLIAPDPFEGKQIAFEIPTRSLPDRPYTEWDAALSFRRRPSVGLKGAVSGG